MDYPIYEIVIDETGELGMGYMSIVDKPAIESNFLMFSEHLKYAVNDERRVITGPAIIADKPIYREINGQPCYTVFTVPVIEKIVKKWAANQNYSLVNTQHSDPVNGIHLFESYIIDRERGLNPPKEFSDISNGSWFVSYYVTNDELWQEIKDGQFKGFSIEINADLQKTDYSELHEFIREVNEFLANYDKTNT